MSAPQSPPCATNLLYPRRFISTIPGTRDVSRVPAGSGRLAGEPVARHRRNHDVERVRCAPAMGRRIGQRIDDLDLLEHGAGPAMRDDQRERIGLLRTDMDEMNVQPVDRRHELRIGVQPRFGLAPVVILLPVARELLHRLELHALRRVRDRLLLGPPCRRDAPFHVGERLVRSVEWKGRMASAPPAVLRLRLCRWSLSQGNRSSQEKCKVCPNAPHGLPPSFR